MIFLQVDLNKWNGAQVTLAPQACNTVTTQ